MFWLITGAYIAYQAGKSNPATVVIQQECKPAAVTIVVVATPVPHKKHATE